MKKRTKTESTQQLRYPVLAKKQKGSTVPERRVRRLLNRQTDKDDREAWQILSATDAVKRGAEWYFLSGCLRHRMGYLTDAHAYLDRACEMSQGKVQEYTDVRDALIAAETTDLSPETLARFGRDQDPAAHIPPANKGMLFFGYVGECCTEGCCDCCTEVGCECCAESACEGCCEGCCEGACDGCSCDC